MIYLCGLTPPPDAPDVRHLPLLRTAFLRPTLPPHDGLILTSKQTVGALQQYGDAWQRLPLLCVGEPTGRRAAAAGAMQVTVAQGYGYTLIARVRQRPRTFRWLYARPRIVAGDFAEQLRAEGYCIEEAIVYETLCQEVSAAPEADAVLIFTSPSAVACFTRQFPLLRTHRLIAIGTTTRRALGEDAARTKMPPEPSIAGCVALARTVY